MDKGMNKGTDKGMGKGMGKDLLNRVLCLLINLVEHDGDNRSALGRVELEEGGESVLALLARLFTAHAEGQAERDALAASRDELSLEDIVSTESEMEDTIVQAYVALLITCL
eukprot:9229676-Pyramimonas_sp.AAC.1